MCDLEVIGAPSRLIDEKLSCVMTMTLKTFFLHLVRIDRDVISLEKFVN